jgi:hypothetical protein
MTVTNSGDAPLHISRVSRNRTGENFQIQNQSCTAASPLAPGSTCTVNIVATPQVEGPLTGLIRFATNIGLINGRLQGAGT